MEIRDIAAFLIERTIEAEIFTTVIAESFAPDGEGFDATQSLREYAARKRVVNLCLTWVDDHPDADHTHATTFLAYLAARYNTHPEYREEWGNH